MPGRHLALLMLALALSSAASGCSAPTPPRAAGTPQKPASPRTEPTAPIGEILPQHEPLPRGALRRYGNHVLRDEGAERIAFVDRGRLLVAASYGRVTVWDPTTGKLVAGHDGAKPFAGSPTAPLYATEAGLMGDGVSLMDARHGTEKRRIETKADVVALAFSADGSALGVLTKGGGVAIHDPATGKRQRTLRAPAKSKHLALGAGWVAVAHGKAFTLWDAAGKVALEERYDEDVNGLRFAGDRLVVSTDAAATLFDLIDLTTQRVVDDESGYGRALAANGDGYALGSRDGPVAIPSDDGDVLWTARGRLRDLALSPSGVVAGLFEPGVIRLFDSRARREITPAGGHVGRVERVAFNRSGTRMASGDDQGVVLLWDRETTRLLRRHRLRRGRVKGLAFSKDGERLAAVGSGGWLEIFEEGEATLTVNLDGYLRCLSWDHERDRLLIGGKDDQLFVVDPATGATVDRWDLDGTAVAMALSPDGERVAAGGEHGLVWTLDVATGRMARAFGVADEEIDALAFSPDGRKLAVAWWHRLRVIDVASGKEEVALEGYGWDPDQITWTPDGSRIVLTGDDEEVWLVDGADGRVKKRIVGPRGTARVMAVTPDGNELVTGGDDMVLLAWPAAQLASLPGPEDDEPPALDPQEAKLAPWPTVLAEPPCARNRQRSAEGPFHGCAMRQLGTARWRLEGDVGTAALSPDGRLVAGAGGDADEVRIFELASGKLVHRIDLSDDGGAMEIAFLPDGRLLVAPLMGRVRVYDLRHGTWIDELPWGLRIEGQMQLSADGRRLMAERYKEIAVHDFADPGASWTKPVPKYALPTMSGDGRRLLINTDEGSWLLDARTGERLAELDDLPAFYLRLLPNGDILGLGDDFELMVGTPEAGLSPTGIQAHREEPKALQIAADGRTVMLTDDDAVDIVNLREPSRRQRIPLDDAQSVTLSKDGRLLFVGLSQELAILPSNGGPRLNPTDGHRSAPSWLAFDAHDRLWASGYLDEARAWPLTKGAKAATIPTGGERALSADGRVLFTRDNSEAPVKRRALPGGKVTDLAAPPCDYLMASADGGRLVCRAYEAGLSLLDGRTGARLKQWWPEESVDRHALSPAGDVVFAVRGTTLHRLPLQGPERSVSLELEGVDALYAEPTGKHVVVLGDERFQWRDATTLEPVGVLEHWTGFSSVALSPDGRWLALASYHDTLELWEVATKKQRARIRLDDSPPIAVAWSADGETLATGHADTRILLWRRSTLLEK